MLTIAPTLNANRDIRTAITPITSPHSSQAQMNPGMLDPGAQQTMGKDYLHRALRSIRSWRIGSFDPLRIPKLLMLGYPTEEAWRKYEKKGDWEQFYKVFMAKIDNINIVSGLLLASTCK
ncbi:hypothetical protein ACEPAI_3559 [Sanghuangporus weigelae]